jgi:hypothetical protein
MSLRDEIVAEIWGQGRLEPVPKWCVHAADAILALVRAHLTSDEAVERGVIAAWTPRNAFDVSGIIRAAILAALGEGK